MAVLVQPDPDEILRPSKAVRWGGGCPGSHALEPHYPEDEDGPEAREGTAAHHYNSEALYGRVLPVGALAPNGHPITAEMVEYGELFLDDVRATLAEWAATGDHVQFYVEAKVYAHKTIHPKNEGTPDVFIINWTRKIIVVLDYKYGHRYVDPFNNEQLINYFAAILETFGIDREAAKNEWTASLRVIQPRNFHRDGPVRRWDTTGRVLVGLIDNLRRAAHAAKAINPQTQTGPWCRDCQARRGCDANMRAAASAMDVAGDTVPHDLPPQAVGLELRHLNRAAALIKQRLEALEEQGLAIIRDGGTIPYYTRGYVQGHEKWTVPAAEVFILGEVMGVDLHADPEPVSPAKARKAGMDPALVASFTIKPTGAAKLLSADDTAAAKAFGSR